MGIWNHEKHEIEGPANLREWTRMKHRGTEGTEGKAGRNGPQISQMTSIWGREEVSRGGMRI